MGCTNVAIGRDSGTQDGVTEQSCVPRLASQQPRRDDAGGGWWLLLASSVGGAAAAALLLMHFKGFGD